MCDVYDRVNHSKVAIVEPVGSKGISTNREVEEAMHKVKEAQSLVSATVNGNYFTCYLNINFDLFTTHRKYTCHARQSYL